MNLKKKIKLLERELKTVNKKIKLLKENENSLPHKEQNLLKKIEKLLKKEWNFDIYNVIDKYIDMIDINLEKSKKQTLMYVDIDSFEQEVEQEIEMKINDFLVNEDKEIFDNIEYEHNEDLHNLYKKFYGYDSYDNVVEYCFNNLKEQYKQYGEIYIDYNGHMEFSDLDRIMINIEE